MDLINVRLSYEHTYLIPESDTESDTESDIDTDTDTYDTLE